MRKDIHPELSKVVFKLPNGDSMETRSTLKSRDGTYHVDVLYLDCPAWNDGKFATANEKASQVADFKRKYGDIFGDAS